MLWIASIFLLVVLVAAWLWWWPSFQRTRVMQTPFPVEWAELLNQNLPVYSRLSDAEREGLHKLILYFLHQKQYVGCAGLEIDDEIRVTIAAEACLLILHQPSTLYEKLRFIYVYPHAYQAPHVEVSAGGVVSESVQGRLGESWENGKIVLSWDDVEHGTHDFSDGENVVLHEFAHQLDQESGIANGAPLLKDRASYRRWASVLSDEFEQLQKEARLGRRRVMKHYGATNPAEFFAVVTEHFFEQPKDVEKRHPELFAELVDYYGVDPKKWL